MCHSSWAHRWRGNYAGKIQLWFPANYVEELANTDAGTGSEPLGSLQKGTIDLTGVTIGSYFFENAIR